MVIANPIYDVVFKRMMENERVAKFFISTLLNETIVGIEVKPQEFTYVDGLAGIAVFRLDFIATILTENGEHKKILIEIQKAKNQIDLMRFRNYLVGQYKKENTLNKEKTILPLTTIYILDFILPEIESACIKVERNYKDLINNSTIAQKSDLVEKLRKDSFVVQVDRITKRYQSRLDKLLSVFEQDNFIDDRKITKEYIHTADNENVKIITDILHHSGTDPKSRKEIETEVEAWRSVNAMFADTRRDFEEKIEKQQEELEKQQEEMEKQQKLIEDLKKQLKGK